MTWVRFPPSPLREYIMNKEHKKELLKQLNTKNCPKFEQLVNIAVDLDFEIANLDRKPYYFTSLLPDTKNLSETLNKISPYIKDSIYLDINNYKSGNSCFYSSGADYESHFKSIYGMKTNFLDCSTFYKYLNKIYPYENVNTLTKYTFVCFTIWNGDIYLYYFNYTSSPTNVFIPFNFIKNDIEINTNILPIKIIIPKDINNYDIEKYEIIKISRELVLINPIIKK